jgi:hypothetical protein
MPPKEACNAENLKATQLWLVCRHGHICELVHLLPPLSMSNAIRSESPVTVTPRNSTLLAPRQHFAPFGTSSQARKRVSVHLAQQPHMLHESF